MQSPVNAPGKHPAKRTYDARRRRQLAAESLHSVRTTARELFLTQGFGTTTIAQIARAAGVSAESVYKNFGSKAGLVRAIYDESLLGAGGPPAEQRSDLAQATETDPVRLMERFGRFTTEVSPIGAPVYLLIRDAAASRDASMAALLRDVDEARYRRMLHNARQLVGRGLLRPGLTAAEAADVMFTSTAAELYETLVIKREWSAERYGTFIARTLAANLL